MDCLQEAYKNGSAYMGIQIHGTRENNNYTYNCILLDNKPNFNKSKLVKLTILETT